MVPKIAASVNSIGLSLTANDPTGERHQQRADDEQSLSAKAVGHRGNDHRHHRAAGKGCGKYPTDRRRA